MPQNSHNVVLPPLILARMQMEVSIHELPKAMCRELKLVFPGFEKFDNVLAIPTFQCSVNDLIQIGDDIATEKDELLEKFVAFSKAFCSAMKEINADCWVDYIDPASGLPMLTEHTNMVYNEVDGMQMLLGYSIMQASCCKVILHPQWGSHIYPATLFTTAPPDVVRQYMQSLEETMIT